EMACFLAIRQLILDSAVLKLVTFGRHADAASEVGPTPMAARRGPCCRRCFAPDRVSPSAHARVRHSEGRSPGSGVEQEHVVPRPGCGRSRGDGGGAVGYGGGLRVAGTRSFTRLAKGGGTRAGPY